MIIANNCLILWIFQVVDGERNKRRGSYGCHEPPAGRTRGHVDARAIAVSPVDGHLLDAMVRIARLLDAPDEAPVLIPLITREIIYRLLRGEQGARLRHLAILERMPCPALPGGMTAPLYDLVKLVEETTILKSRKDGKGTAHHLAISPPTGSQESFQIALEDRAIESAWITCFDPKHAEAGSKKVANIRGNSSQTWIGPINGNRPVLSIPPRGCKQVPAPGIQVTEGLREPLKHVEQGIVILPQLLEAGSDRQREGSTKPWVLPECAYPG
jgi:hypothetical protein